jgi:hypothetical protein
MRVAFLVPLAAIAGCVSAPEPATKQQPERVVGERVLWTTDDAAIRQYVEGAIGDRFGADAVRQANAARTSVMAASIRGHFGSGGPNVNAVVRSASGWSGWRSGRAAPVSAATSAELDRLLADPALWAEPDRFPEMDCPDSGAHLLVIRHAGRSKISRQSCSPANRLGRLLETVLEEQPQ